MVTAPSISDRDATCLTVMSLNNILEQYDFVDRTTILQILISFMAMKNCSSNEETAKKWVKLIYDQTIIGIDEIKKAQDELALNI